MAMTCKSVIAAWCLFAGAVSLVYMAVMLP
jgi:hypothetical protein